jgi:DNA-binding MarR family transcriptional regulator
MAPQHRPIIEISKQLAWTYLRLQRMLDRCLAGSEASVARVRLLAYVADGPKRSTDIASFFGHAPRTVTEAIDALEAAGHLRRRVVPEDRRVKLVELTPAGREVLDRAQPGI